MPPPPDDPLDILCLAHLPWEERLFQRPQHLMLQMAARGHRVRYLAPLSSRIWLRRRLGLEPGALNGAPAPGLSFDNIPWTPLTRRLAPARSLHRARLRRAARRRARELDTNRLVLWLYHPAWLPAAEALPQRLILYDVMDLFAGFSSIQPEELQNERRLLERADLVFTGGRSLQQAVARRRPPDAQPHCFPSGVDLEHFARARLPETAPPPELERLPRPRLGYYGAVDERLDWPLLRRLAEAFPTGSILLIGPRVGAPPPDRLPPNLHLLGPRPYAQLPACLKAFDLALLPFAQSQLTRHISPTKTPEYLAGNRPVVSTAVPDVAADFGQVVHIADDTEGFVAACRQALDQGPPDEALLRPLLEARRWSAIAQEMEARIRELT